MKVEYFDKGSDDKYGRDEYLALNDIHDKNSSVIGEGNYQTLILYDPALIEEICKYSPNKLSEKFSRISFRSSRCLGLSNRTEIQINLLEVHRYGPRPMTICIEIGIDFEEWNKLWSISEYAKEIESVTSSFEKATFFQDDDFVTNGIGVELEIDNIDDSVSIATSEATSLTEDILNQAERNLIASFHKDSLVTFFDFPPEIKMACEQYLVYFSQFLSDLGISANTELKNDVHQVMFSVTPDNNEIALKNIKQALDCYLRASDIDDVAIYSSQSSDIAAKQWESNIYHLKSQLALASATIQAKDVVISSLQLTNYQLIHTLETSEINSGSSNKNENESLFDGIIELKKYESRGISIDFAEIFRRLKRRF